MPAPSEAPWWRSLAAAVDPISLEPIAALAYPPFELRADVQSSTSSDWFDGRTLALYLVSSCRFTHPISRRAARRLGGRKRGV